MQTKGIVLAGGRSERMGQDKALIPYKGRTLLDQAVSLLEETGIDEIAVLGRPHEKGGVKDLSPFNGPAKAIIDWIEKQTMPFRLVAIPVDMPFLTADILRILLATPDGAYFDDLYLPFAATIRESIQIDTLRMKDLVQKLGLERLDRTTLDSKKLANINETSDLGLLSVPK